MKDQVTQFATIMNQHIKLTINFSSKVVQLYKIASLNSNNFFCPTDSEQQLLLLSRGRYGKKIDYVKKIWCNSLGDINQYVKVNYFLCLSAELEFLIKRAKRLETSLAGCSGRLFISLPN